MSDAGRGRREPYIGRAMPRFEDRRLVAGRGRFSDDIAASRPGLCGIRAFAPRPCPHRRHRHRAPPPGSPACSRSSRRPTMRRRAGAASPTWRIRPTPTTSSCAPSSGRGGRRRSMRRIRRSPSDRVRHVGEPVAMVVADTAAAAQDAAERVVVRYEVLPAVTDALAALAPGAPRASMTPSPAISRSTPSSAIARRSRRPCAEAALVVAQTFRAQRVASAHMEPRAALGAYDADAGPAHALHREPGRACASRTTIAACLGVPPERVRVVTHDVGGAFGLLSNVYLRAGDGRLRRAPSRSPGEVDRRAAPTPFSPTTRAAIIVIDGRLALAADGRILALASRSPATSARHPVTYVPLSNASRVTPTVYDIPHAAVTVRAARSPTRCRPRRSAAPDGRRRRSRSSG